MKIAQNKAFGPSRSFVAGPPKNGFHFMVKDPRKYASTAGRRDPEGRSYFSFASFEDPDGNRWLLQEITTRLPGREWK